MFGPTKEKKFDFELFTMYDSKTQIYDRPVFAQNKNDLIREVINMMKSPEEKKNRLVLNAEDFSIFKVGAYDKSTGKLEGCNPEHVANLNDLRAIAGPVGIEAT